jgi:hypothetical protein
MQIIGDSPLAPKGPGLFRKGLGTVFPTMDMLVTLPGIHASQRMAFVDHLNAMRMQSGQSELAPDAAEEAWTKSVDLFFEEDCILIRPDPDNMPLAFEADELLQALTSKHNIKFLQVTNERVGQAIKARGECWRISPLPTSSEAIKEMIRGSRTSIGGDNLYYYNRLTGTRFLTCDAFQGMNRLPPESLARHLEEIRLFSQRKNRLQQPEIAFFQAVGFGSDTMRDIAFPDLNMDDLRRVHRDLANRFLAAVPAEMRRDDVEILAWRNAMFTALVGQQNEPVAEEILHGLSPEYFLQIEWLPGCRIEMGELLFDSIFNEFEKYPNREDLRAVCDTRVKSFIFNFTREFGELEYVNVARLPRTLSRRAQAVGRRGVYLAEIKPCHQAQPIVRMIRMQKWDVAGHLDKGKDLLGAMLEAAEYSDYVLDRRLACRQLGMNLVLSIMMHRLSEAYDGLNGRYTGQTIWSTYFERDYFAGIATDKITPSKLEIEAYAVNLARLLGKAAAVNMIVGRLDLHNRVLFDDGDEIILEEQGLPSEILISDPTGAFGDYQFPLENHMPDYAAPVIRRWHWLKNPPEFAEAYAQAIEAEFRRIQQEYRRRRRAFDSLFHHRTRNVLGSFAYRWEKVLERLDLTKPYALCQHLRSAITDGTEPLAKARRESGSHSVR